MSTALCLKGQFRMILKIILKKKELSGKQQAASFKLDNE
jgi:hypothetical protein